MDKRYQNKLVRLDRFADEEIITFRYLAAKFSKGWGRAEIRSGIIIQAKYRYYFKHNSIYIFFIIDKVDVHNRICRVYAIDYGETETVNFENLRKLPEKFRRKLPEQLECVYLSELHGDRINQETKTEIENMTQQKNIFQGLFPYLGT